MEEITGVGIGGEVADVSTSRDTGDKELKSVVIVGGSMNEAREASEELADDREANGASTRSVVLAVMCAIPLP